MKKIIILTCALFSLVIGTIAQAMTVKDNCTIEDADSTCSYIINTIDVVQHINLRFDKFSLEKDQNKVVCRFLNEKIKMSGITKIEGDIEKARVDQNYSGILEVTAKENKQIINGELEVLLLGDQGVVPRFVKIYQCHSK